MANGKAFDDELDKEADEARKSLEGNSCFLCGHAPSSTDYIECFIPPSPEKFSVEKGVVFWMRICEKCHATPKYEDAIEERLIEQQTAVDS